MDGGAGHSPERIRPRRKKLLAFGLGIVAGIVAAKLVYDALRAPFGDWPAFAVSLLAGASAVGFVILLVRRMVRKPI